MHSITVQPRNFMDFRWTSGESSVSFFFCSFFLISKLHQPKNASATFFFFFLTLKNPCIDWMSWYYFWVISKTKFKFKISIQVYIPHFRTGIPKTRLCKENLNAKVFFHQIKLYFALSVVQDARRMVIWSKLNYPRFLGVTINNYHIPPSNYPQ